MSKERLGSLGSAGEGGQRGARLSLGALKLSIGALSSLWGGGQLSI